MSKPLVSILIRSMDIDHLDGALKSIEEQTYSNIEIVVVNASGKDHRELSPFIGTFSLRFIDSDSPLPRAKAANRALQHAQGTFALFLDDDDWIDADHIEKLVLALEDENDAVLAYTGTRVIDENGNESGMYTFDFNRDQIYAGNFIPIHSVLFRMEVLHKYQCFFDEKLDLYEDWDFWIQLSQYGEFKHVPGISANYRVEHGGRSGVQSELESKKSKIGIYTKWQHLWKVEAIIFLADEAAKARTIDNLKSMHHQEIENKNQEIENKNREIETKNHRLNELKEANETLMSELYAILNSHSWKITQPLRKMMKMVKNISAK